MASFKIEIPSFEEIADFNFYYLKMKSNKDHLSEQSVLKIFLTLIIRFIYEFIRDLKHAQFLYHTKNKDLFFATTPNQLKALISLYKNHARRKCLYYTSQESKQSTNKIPQSLSTFFSLILFPLFLIHYFKANSDQRRNIRLSRNDVALSYGNYYFILLHFWFYKPTSIILSNDHLCQHRIWMKLGSRFGVPSIYIQHAPVTAFFPPLEFDLSLLEGEVSKNKYLASGSVGRIELIGMIKFDEYFSVIRKVSERKHAIGISINLLDDLNEIRRLILRIKNELNEYKIIFRPHPSTLSSRYKHIYKKIEDQILTINGLEMSNPLKENSFEFIARIDANIAGKSGIHLDATLMNIASIYYVSDGSLDNQSFVENKLVSSAFDEDELICLLKHLTTELSEVRFLSKRFVDTVSTSYDGKSTELAFKSIEEFLRTYSNEGEN